MGRPVLFRDAMRGRYDQDNLPPGRLVPELQTGVEYPLGKRTAPGFDVSSGFAGTAAEHELVRSIAAPVLGTSSDEVVRYRSRRASTCAR